MRDDETLEIEVIGPSTDIYFSLKNKLWFGSRFNFTFFFKYHHQNVANRLKMLLMRKYFNETQILKLKIIQVIWRTSTATQVSWSLSYFTNTHVYIFIRNNLWWKASYVFFFNIGSSVNIHHTAQYTELKLQMLIFLSDNHCNSNTYRQMKNFFRLIEFNWNQIIHN